MANKNGVSRVLVYIGIPTQEFRTVLSEVAQLIGELLSLPHSRAVLPKLAGFAETKMADESETPHKDDAYTAGPITEDEQLKTAGHRKHLFFVEGASSHSSVFGYWMGGDEQNRRVDDHSEVVEFILDPTRHAPSILLMMSDVVFPALFVSRQDVILMVSEHRVPSVSQPEQSLNHRVEVFPFRDLSKQTETLSQSLLLQVERRIDPLSVIAQVFGGFHKALCTAESGATRDTSWDATIDSGWLQWLRAEPWLNEQPAKGRRISPSHEWFHTTERSRNIPGYLPDGPSDIYLGLPAVNIRLLVQMTSWWAFLGASETFRTFEIDSEVNLWGGSTAGIEVRRLVTTYLRLVCEWLRIDTDLRTQSLNELVNDELWPNYFSQLELKRESGDALANGVLWLAFVGHVINNHYAEFIGITSPSARSEPLNPVVRPRVKITVQINGGAEKNDQSLTVIASVNDKQPKSFKLDRKGSFTLNPLKHGDSVFIEIEGTIYAVWCDKDSDEDVVELQFAEEPAELRRLDRRLSPDLEFDKLAARLEQVFERGDSEHKHRKWLSDFKSVTKSLGGRRGEIEKRLAYLEDVDDGHFPDHHLLSSWRMFLRIRQVQDNKNTKRLATSGWWVQMQRLWRSAPATAQLWLSPLILDVCFSGLCEVCDPEYNAGVIDADGRVDLSPMFKHNGTTRLIYRIASEAIRGFPINNTSSDFAIEQYRRLAETENPSPNKAIPIYIKHFNTPATRPTCIRLFARFLRDSLS